jgi:hypothetical protein
MRKFLLGLVLSLVATVASAEWVLLGQSSRGDKIYVDPATKSRNGNIVRMWSLSDYAKPQVSDTKPYSSDRGYFQFDCAERTSQLLRLTSFTGPMLTGEMEGSVNNPGKIIFIAPDTVQEALLNFACK